MNKYEVAEDFAKEVLDRQVQQSALQRLFPNAELPYNNYYESLVKDVLGDQLFDWLEWWIYEAKHGTTGKFWIDGIDYETTNMTLNRFLELVDTNEYSKTY